MSTTKPPTGKQLKNEETLTTYAFFLVAFILFVALVRKLRVSQNTAHQSPSSWYGRAYELSRRSRCLIFEKYKIHSAWEWFGRPSVGLSAIVGIFFIANIVLCSNFFASHALNHFASRYGWMGAANMALCVFFGAKNTPLSLISAVSHVEINMFHRIAGYAAALLILLHATLYTVHLGRQGRLAKLLEASDLAGIGAGTAMLILTLTGLYRQGRYEMFYVAHIAGFGAVVILAVLHRPDWAKKLPYVMLFITCLWITDRIARAARLSWNAVNNRVTCHPLPGGGTRLFLKKSSAQAAPPGSFCYLWIPRVRLFQMHPFTIVSNGPAGLELIVKTHNGFTKDLGDFAMEQPGRATWVSFDGPYGPLPDTTVYQKLLFIAGGSGATFTFGLLNRMWNRSERLPSQSVDFIWTVKHTKHLGWFGKYVRHLAKADSSVNMALHVTSDNPNLEDSEAYVNLAQDSDLERKSDVAEVEPLLSAPANEDSECFAKLNVKYKRLDVEAQVQDVVSRMESHDRMLIIMCGPKSLMNTVEDTIYTCQGSRRKRIDICSSSFRG